MLLLLSLLAICVLGHSICTVDITSIAVKEFPREFDIQRSTHIKYVLKSRDVRLGELLTGEYVILWRGDEQQAISRFGSMQHFHEFQGIISLEGANYFKSNRFSLVVVDGHGNFACSSLPHVQDLVLARSEPQLAQPFTYLELETMVESLKYGEKKLGISLKSRKVPQERLQSDTMIRFVNELLDRGQSIRCLFSRLEQLPWIGIEHLVMFPQIKLDAYDSIVTNYACGISCVICCGAGVHLLREIPREYEREVLKKIPPTSLHPIMFHLAYLAPRSDEPKSIPHHLVSKPGRIGRLPVIGKED